MKTRKQMRGFDITQYLAFKTFPEIKHINLIEELEENRVTVMDTRTGTIETKYCNNIADCRELAKAVNKMIRDNTKWLEEHHEEH